MDDYDDMLANGKFTEDQLERAIIELFEDEDYGYLNGEYLHRKLEEPLLTDILEDSLRRRYADLSLTDSEVAKAVNNLRYVPTAPLYTGSKAAFRLVNEGFDLVRDDPALPAAHIDYVDYDDVAANDFKVVNQLVVVDKANRRPDLLLYVNGIPLVICEFKTAIEEDTTVHDAWEQIAIRYNRDIPRLMRYCCLAVISDGANTRLGTPFTPYEYFYSWNKVDDGGEHRDGIGSLYTMVAGALSPDRLLRVVRDFIFYPDGDAKQTEIVCRYPQFFAATKMLDSVVHHLRPGGDGKGGTYFGATGCGKTYTMLFLTRLMTHRRRAALHNPSVIVLVDREDLDSQTSALFVTAKEYLHDGDVRSIESRRDLYATLHGKESGGVYVTTIQKFCEGTGLLSDRCNIVCISDEAHRTQTGVGAKLKKTESGVFTTYGFAKYLRDSFPNATYCGFTGTPVDETLSVFGPVVDRYTMRQSAEDGITVPISYEPRLARVQLSDEETRKIQAYYDRCASEGSTPDQIEESQRAMSAMSVILRNPDRLSRLAADLVEHYEALCVEKPGVVQKAMVVCSDRMHAYDLYRQIVAIRPEWGVPKRAEDEDALTPRQLDELKPIPKMNIVATRGKNDPEELYDLCGSKEHRKELDKLFKDNASNFKVAVVVDMWITGFDVPSLAVMYIDKPLQKHTLVQTISRVNRVFGGKDRGLVVDYIGIRENMLQAIKAYGDDGGSSVDELTVTLGVFRNHLALVGDLMRGFDASRFHSGTPRQRLDCLNDAAEFVQSGKELETRFMGLTRILKQTYAICFPSGELGDREVATAQFYLAIRSIIYKQTRGDAPDADAMNAVVEDMVRKAISCTGVESVVEAQQGDDLFSEEFSQQLDQVKMPITKFNALLKLLRKAIRAYGRTNQVKAVEFSERLKKVVEAYNTRDNLQFTSEVVADFVNDLSDKIIVILRDLKEDQESFEKMGITYEEKAFYDILVKVRDEHGFPYAEEKCIALAKAIRALIDDKSQYADWSTREDIKSQLDMDLTVLLYENGYPPQWNDEVFEKVMAQATNYKAT